MKTEAQETEVAIVGGGPVGTYLANRLRDQGVPLILVERRSREEAAARGRAGLLEHRVAELLLRHGLSEGFAREGKPHRGCTFHSRDGEISLDLAAMVGGRARAVYPQDRLVADLTERLLQRGARLLFETEAEAIEVTEAGARLRCRGPGGAPLAIEARRVVACDGPRGLARRALAASHPYATYVFPYVWLAILARCPPSAPHVVYGVHAEGFAGHMLRTSELTRFYLQIGPEEGLGDRTDEAIWEALAARLEVPGFALRRGPILERSIFPLRSSLAPTFAPALGPDTAGRLLLAGDAAHTVSPCGGKGMNLGLLDAELLAERLPAALEAERSGRPAEARALLEAYAEERRADVLRVQKFVHEMTWLLHARPERDPEARANPAFEAELRLAYLRRLRDDPGERAAFARAYTGLASP